MKIAYIGSSRYLLLSLFFVDFVVIDATAADDVAVVAFRVLTMSAMIGGDLNGHIGQSRDGFEEASGVYGCGERNREGEKILEFCQGRRLVMCGKGNGTLTIQCVEKMKILR